MQKTGQGSRSNGAWVTDILPQATLDHNLTDQRQLWEEDMRNLPSMSGAGFSKVAEAPWGPVAEWAVALRFDHPRATVLVLLLSDTPHEFWGPKRPKHS